MPALRLTVQGAGVPQYVQHLHFVTVGNEDGKPRAVHRQINRVICQLPLQHTFLPVVVPDPADMQPAKGLTLVVNLPQETVIYLPPEPAQLRNKCCLLTN